MDASQLLDEYRKGASSWNAYRKTLPAGEVIDLTGQDLRGFKLLDFDLSGIKLVRANLRGCDMRNVDLTGADLSHAVIEWTKLYDAKLVGAHLDDCRAQGADFRKADLTDATLCRAQFRDATFREAVLVRATIEEADLTNAVFVQTDLRGARLIGCQVFGCAAWRPQLEGAVQSGLIITPFDEAKVVVDDLEIAQFLNLLLDNRKVRNVLDGVTSRAVLLLGRFTDDRKAVLDALSVALRAKGYVPILFDFPPSEKRDLTETIQIIGGLVKFVLADLSEAKSIPQELSVIVPFLPSVVVAAVIAEDFEPYALYEHWARGYRNVLPLRRYSPKSFDAAAIVDTITGDVDAWKKGSQLQVLEQALRREQEARAALEKELATLRAGAV